MDVTPFAYWNTLAQIGNTLAVFASLLVVCAAIIWNLRIARKAQTATFLYESRADERYSTGLQVLRMIHHSGKSFRSYIFPVDEISPLEIEQRQQLVYFLNFYERLAVGVHHGTYHEEMVKQIFYSGIVNNFIIVKPFINAIRERTERDTYYQEYEYLVHRWRHAPLRVKNKKRVPL